MDLLAILMMVFMAIVTGGIPGFPLLVEALTSPHGTWKHIFQAVALSTGGVVSFGGPIAAAVAVMRATSSSSAYFITIMLTPIVMGVGMVALMIVGDRITDRIRAAESKAFTNAMLSRYTNHTM